MADLSHTDRQLAEATLNSGKALMLLDVVNDAGEPGYLYVSIRLNMLKEFEEEIQRGQGVDVDKYCHVIASGHGTPTAEVKQAMEEEYGFDHAQEKNKIQFSA